MECRKGPGAAVQGAAGRGIDAGADPPHLCRRDHVGAVGRAPYPRHVRVDSDRRCQRREARYGRRGDGRASRWQREGTDEERDHGQRRQAGKGQAGPADRCPAAAEPPPMTRRASDGRIARRTSSSRASETRAPRSRARAAGLVAQARRSSASAAKASAVARHGLQPSRWSPSQAASGAARGPSSASEARLAGPRMRVVEPVGMTGRPPQAAHRRRLARAGRGAAGARPRRARPRHVRPALRQAPVGGSRGRA